jgi:hypothetical protein
MPAGNLMQNENPSHALLALFKGGKEFALVSDDITTGEWDVPSFSVWKKPDARLFEMSLSKYFRNVTITSVEEIDLTQLKETAADFADVKLYMCDINPALSRTGMVFYMNKHTEWPGLVSPRARAILSLPGMQSRLI